MPPTLWFSPYIASVENVNAPNGVYASGEVLHQHRVLLCGDKVWISPPEGDH